MISILSFFSSYGLDFLLKKTEQNVMDMTGRKKMRFRTGTGSPELSWLNRNVTVVDHIADDKDPNYSIVTVIMSEVDLKQFKKAASLK